MMKTIVGEETRKVEQTRKVEKTRKVEDEYLRNVEQK